MVSSYGLIIIEGFQTMIWVEDNANGIKATGRFLDALIEHIKDSHSLDLGDFTFVYHFFWTTKLVSDFGFDFHKNQGGTILDNEIYFSKFTGVISFKNG